MNCIVRECEAFCIYEYYNTMRTTYIFAIVSIFARVCSSLRISTVLSHFLNPVSEQVEIVFKAICIYYLIYIIIIGVLNDHKFNSLHSNVTFDMFFQFVIVVGLLPEYNLLKLILILAELPSSNLINHVYVKKIIDYFNYELNSVSVKESPNSSFSNMIQLPDEFRNTVDDINIRDFSNFLFKKTKAMNDFIIMHDIIIDRIFSFVVHSSISYRMNHKHLIMEYDIQFNTLPPLSCVQRAKLCLFCMGNPYTHDYIITDDRKLMSIFLECGETYRKYNAVRPKANSIKLLQVPVNSTILKLKRVGSSHSFVKPCVVHPRSSLSSLTDSSLCMLNPDSNLSKVTV